MNPLVEIEYNGLTHFEFLCDVVDANSAIRDFAKETLVNRLMSGEEISINGETYCLAQIIGDWFVDHDLLDQFIVESDDYRPEIEEAFKRREDELSITG